jgi:hypothetical protein
MADDGNVQVVKNRPRGELTRIFVVGTRGGRPVPLQATVVMVLTSLGRMSLTFVVSLLFLPH